MESDDDGALGSWLSLAFISLLVIAGVYVCRDTGMYSWLSHSFVAPLAPGGADGALWQ